MRVRTEDKRREIVVVAADLFEELGFERTTMSLISKRVGGSKATLYGYFRSKEELLLAVLEYDIAEQADALLEQFLGAEDLRDGLIVLGTGYLERRLASRPIANIRMVANQPAGSGIGKTFYEALLRPGWRRLADRFALLMDQGSLRRADPWIAAMHWKGLVEWDMPDRLLLGAIDAGDPEEIRMAVVTGTDAFLRLYGAAAGDR
ncbi:TetR/AcrR family transcriptional regulator [Sphingomonas canadensis]|uniref:TetR/AcrR family transcriptional regulator n=1 Tax=Sphingomonas canadensis TaxID=1219257 RepID=A0ABW3H5I4_9SPHN|nr:TetR/AcrR family transcriptional regulator [Sphingomonas canadensis]MCW3834667.1 TetR/AcrR family transcriptional regulator [Sphingomonas canadensis]